MSSDPLPSTPPRPDRPVVVVSNRQDLPVEEEELVDLARRVLVGEGIPQGELSLSLVSDEEMADLHIRYMGEEGPTDVLSFPMHEEGLIGDVVVCLTVAKRNNPNLRGELRLLVVHGVLHLLGYDHEREDDRDVMWKTQDRYLGLSA